MIFINILRVPNLMTSRFIYLLFLPIFISLSISAQALVVLQYHHVDKDTPNSTSVSPEQFIQHMQLIEDLGFDVVDLEAASRELLADRNKFDSTSKQVAISFDDAYFSIYTNAFPELKRRNWPFTIFVNTQAVNERNRGIMSWEQLKDLVDEGVSIANHSVSHAHLPSIPLGMSLDQWLQQEILEAQIELQQRLTKVGNMLAYPYGEFTLAMVPWLEQHDMLAFGQQSGPIGTLSHPQALSRFPASGIYADLASLKTKLLSLALPIDKTQLQNPMLHEGINPPLLNIQLLNADYNPANIQCFASQQGAIETTIKKVINVYSIQTRAPERLKGKRARYNCTVISSQKGRFYWYSQPWQMY